MFVVEKHGCSVAKLGGLECRKTERVHDFVIDHKRRDVERIGVCRSITSKRPGPFWSFRLFEDYDLNARSATVTSRFL